MVKRWPQSPPATRRQRLTNTRLICRGILRRLPDWPLSVNRRGQECLYKQRPNLWKTQRLKHRCWRRNFRNKKSLQPSNK